MARPKKVAAPEKKQKPKRDPRIEQVYEQEVSFMCPVRGLVKQKVKIKRFKTLEEQTSKHLVATIDELTSALDEKDDGLSIYSDGEELGITGISEESE